ncbi:MAG: hypothetical protein EOO90_10825 [Pedobacter sp.]|nr:MAG: hypothetical protein EOO90_10825 [Pedobacter sp.]
MSNKLENFVRENKRSFNEKGPSDQLWARIEVELDKKESKSKKIKLYQWMSVAAVLILSVGLYFNLRPNTNEIIVADINADYGKKANRFVNIIEEKKDSLQLHAVGSPELYNRFKNDIAQLDSDYEKLRQQLQTSTNREEIVRAMIKNLEIRSNILSQQLNIINQVNQFKKENII